MQKQGYIYLEDGKGRDKYIHLTSEGNKLLQEKIFPVIELENETFASMSAEEAGELLRLMRKYVDIFGEKIKKL